MHEYVSDALVLAKYDSGDQDGRYALFTKRFGKIIGRAKSSRKITSKLSGHLEPGTILKVRFIEQKGIQLVDALKSSRSHISFPNLLLLNELISEMEQDDELWEYLQCDTFIWSDMLAMLGWDPAHAVCPHCGRAIHSLPVAFFYIPRQEFFCADYVSKLKPSAVSLIQVESS